MRKLTLEILAEQPVADWIWESHMQGVPHDGVTVIGISDGHTSITSVQGDAFFDPVCCKCGDLLVSYELVCDDCRYTP